MKKFAAAKVWPQYFLTFLCNIGTISFGLNIGWLSPLQPQFTDSTGDSVCPLGEGVCPLTTNEISWIGAIPAVSLLIGAPIFGFIVQKIGRKLTCLLGIIPNVISFTVLLFSSNVYMVYIARFISGFSSAGTLIVTPIYVNETARGDLRGVLCSVSGLFINMGVIVAFVLGAFTSYVVMNLICLAFSLTFLLFYLWMPESPVYLLTKNKTKEAQEALFKLRGGTWEEIENEISQMYNSIIENKSKASKDSALKTLLGDRATRYALFIILGIMTTQQLCGISAIVGYAVSIFQESGSAISPFIAAILVSVTQLCGSTIGAVLVTRMGRKTLLMISTIIMSKSLFSVSIFVYAKNHSDPEYIANLGWIPSVGLMIYIAAYAVGFGTVPFILGPELFRPEARGLAGAVGSCWVSMLAFFIVKFFPIWTEIITLAGSLPIFAAGSAIGSAFIYFMVFETKGKTLDEILWILRSRSHYYAQVTSTNLENATIKRDTM